MGLQQSILARFLRLKFDPLKIDVPSPDDDGKTVVMSKTFKQAGVEENFDKFLECLMDAFRKPPLYWMFRWRFLLKYKDIKQKEDEDGTLYLQVKYVLDGTKLRWLQGDPNIPPGMKALHLPPTFDGQDVVVWDNEYMVKKEHRAVYCRAYNMPRFDEGDREVSGTLVMKVLDPMALTMYSESPDGIQSSGKEVAALLSPFLEHVARDMCRKVRMLIDEEENVIFTRDPMDPFITYSELFSKVVQSIKDGPLVFAFQLASEAENDGVQALTYNKADGTEAGFLILTTDESAGDIILESNFPDHPAGKQVRQHFQITKDPLSYKTWLEDPDGTTGCNKPCPDELYLAELEKMEVLLTQGGLKWLLSSK